MQFGIGSKNDSDKKEGANTRKSFPPVNSRYRMFAYRCRNRGVSSHEQNDCSVLWGVGRVRVHDSQGNFASDVSFSPFFLKRDAFGCWAVTIRLEGLFR